MAEETKDTPHPQAVAAANAPTVAHEAAAAVAVLEQRIVELENAFHGYLTHEGSLHPAVTGWVNKFRAKLAAAIAPATEKGGDSGPSAA